MCLRYFLGSFAFFPELFFGFFVSLLWLLLPLPMMLS
jgi:hypothetical protein